MRTIRQEIGIVSIVGKNLLKEFLALPEGKRLEFVDHEISKYSGHTITWTAYRCWETDEAEDSHYRNAEGMVTD
jgi:hypothetical protein